MKTMMAMLTVIGATGCLAGEAEVAPRTASAEPGAAARAQPLEAEAAPASTEESCRALMQRQRTCTTQFIPALVDARVQHDTPPGVAERERERGREALVAEALAEWESDAQDPNIAALCADIAQAISQEKDALLRDSVSQCLAQAGCEAFVSCAVPLNLVHWKS